MVVLVLMSDGESAGKPSSRKGRGGGAAVSGFIVGVKEGDPGTGFRRKVLELVIILFDALSAKQDRLLLRR